MDPDWLRADLAAIYPQFGLRLAHRGLVLVPPTDAELLELADVVGEPGGILDPGSETFLRWRPGAGPDSVHTFLRYFWDLRRPPVPADWVAPFAVVLDGRVVGMTELRGLRWPADRIVVTGSWLTRADQGRGTGTRIRLMLLELALGHLGATRATTSAAEANGASRRVSTRCGYRETGRGVDPAGHPEVHYAITPTAWRRRRLDDVRIDGVEAFAAAIG